ncbi:glycosyltransferase family 2 protein [Nocardioides sp.]|uniref:glycosyltransferase family 2 protein n=1 Tax=Nocardioides sp. TaxID=35761 RepID=UPI0025F86342|nr:glycosyltransferase family A protein [Nocardioides sp.]
MIGVLIDGVIGLLLLTGLVAGQWLVRDLRTVPTAAGADSGAGRRADVCVVVPARDEERTLPALLASVRAQSSPVAEVVVVDDSSRDATAAVARAAGAHVVDAGPPPAGWTGKAWACHTGTRAGGGDALLFLDADTVLADPEALDGLVALLQERGGLVSVQPFHEVERSYEQLSAYFNLVSLMASGAFAPGGARRRPMAFGPCLLTSRADYERAGGHEAVRGAILDDAALAAAYDRAGLPVSCAVGAEAVRMRSYPGGLRQLVAGWTKNIASGAGAAAPAPTAGAVAWVCVQHAVAVGGVLALVTVLGGGDALATGHPALWAAAWVAVTAQLRWLLGRAGSFRWWTWALFPLPLLAFDLVFARSAALTLVRRSVRWRGREVDLRHGRAEGTA